MKKAYPANIDGQIFYIDDDAFQLLNSYLDQLRATFRGEEGEEIVNDIESRIRELFAARTSAGANVIVLADVNKVIATMGRPEDLSQEDKSEESPQKEKEEGKAPESGKDAPREESQEKPFISFNLPTKKKLYRSDSDKIFGGVFGGLAVYLGWNANIMRILYSVLTIFTYCIPLVVLYLIAWMIIPVASSPRQIMEMTGTPLSVGNIGKAVIEHSPTPPPYYENSSRGFWKTFFTILGKSIMVFFGIISGCIAFACGIGLVCLIIGLIAAKLFYFPDILNGMHLYITRDTSMLISAISSVILALCIFGSITWGAIAVIFNRKGMSTSAILTALIISFICICTVIICNLI